MQSPPASCDAEEMLLQCEAAERRFDRVALAEADLAEE